METPQRSSLCRQSLLGVVLTAALIAPLPALASGVTDAKPAAASYESALKSYNSGNISFALLLAKSAGKLGDVQAQLLAGHILKNGEAGQVNKTDAAKWYLKAAENGNTDAMVALGELGIRSEGLMSPEDARHWLTKAAQFGRTDAMRALAEMHLKGRGAPAKPNEAREWLLLASEQGDPLASQTLGDLYIDREPATALKYYETAARNGNAQAAYIAAVMYAENLAIKPNQTQAAKLMKQAAHSGIAGAMADYGLLIYQGIAGDSKAETAADWFKKAARAGDDQGKFFYAYSLAKGDGLGQNFEQAYFWALQVKPSGIPDYDKDLETLRTGLEGKLGTRAIARIKASLP